MIHHLRQVCKPRCAERLSKRGVRDILSPRPARSAPSAYSPSIYLWENHHLFVSVVIAYHECGEIVHQEKIEGLEAIPSQPTGGRPKWRWCGVLYAGWETCSGQQGMVQAVSVR